MALLKSRSLLNLIFHHKYRDCTLPKVIENILRFLPPDYDHPLYAVLNEHYQRHCDTNTNPVQLIIQSRKRHTEMHAKTAALLMAIDSSTPTDSIRKAINFLKKKAVIEARVSVREIWLFLLEEVCRADDIEGIASRLVILLDSEKGKKETLPRVLHDVYFAEMQSLLRDICDGAHTLLLMYAH